MKLWMKICIALFVLGTAFLFPKMKGYMYITAALYFITACIVIYQIAPETIKRIFFILAAIGVCYFCVVEVFILKDCRGDKNPQRSYVIVLGAAVKGERPSLSLTHRIQKAEEYLTTYPDTKAILSGGKGAGEDISEAQCMYNVLVADGIDPNRLILENQSTSTKENLEFSKELILKDGGSLDDVAIISSPYHLFRAKTMAKDVGFPNVAGVACVHGYPIYSLGMYIREAFGVTHLWVFGD